MAALAIVSRAAVLCIAALGVARAAESVPRAPIARPDCLNAAETRDQVKAHKLLEPYVALKWAAQQRKAEALSAKLCVSGDDFIYVITLLHPNGRLTHVQMEAGRGKWIGRPAHESHDAKDAHDVHEPAPKN
jgi:hypothetical protein